MAKKRNKSKKPKRIEKVFPDKTPSNEVNPDEWLKDAPKWQFSNYDRDRSEWCVHSCSDFIEDILKKLISFEGMNWHQIMDQSGGKRSGSNHHFVTADYFIKEARSKLEKLQYEELFSLRLDGKKRLYGTLEDGIFKIIWYDDKHKIVPSKKRNT